MEISKRATKVALTGTALVPTVSMEEERDISVICVRRRDIHTSMELCKTPQGQCVALKKWERQVTPIQCENQTDQISRWVILVNRCEEILSYAPKSPNGIKALILNKCRNQCGAMVKSAAKIVSVSAAIVGSIAALP
jgi:hypothetical protein